MVCSFIFMVLIHIHGFEKCPGSSIKIILPCFGKDNSFWSVESRICIPVTWFSIFVNLHLVNIQKAKYVDFYIFVMCECSSGYLLFLCHKPLETIVFNSQFYGRLRPITYSCKSIKFFRDNCFFQLFFVDRSVWKYMPSNCDLISCWFSLECLKSMKYTLCSVNPEPFMV